MKKIDKLLLGAFVGPFMMTFLVVVFILLTQHMLKYFDDIIGKGLGLDVIGQLLFYFAIFMTPVALPLAVLLSSLIAFGNLGEHFELTAIKSAGISLVRALRPIFFFVLLLTVVAFYANNNLVPKAALEAYSLLYDIKQKKPALDLREGAFYSGIPDISIKVDKKFEDGITLKNVVVYDHRRNDGNKEVTVADSGKMYTILNERYLKFELFRGYNYSESAALQKDASGKGRIKTESLTRSKFDKSQIVFDLSDLDMKTTDKKWFQGNRIMRNLSQLDSDMDSINKELLTQRLNYYQFQPSYFSYFDEGDTVRLPPELKKHQLYQDSMLRAKFQSPQPIDRLKGDGPDVAAAADSSSAITDSMPSPIADTLSPSPQADTSAQTKMQQQAKADLAAKKLAEKSKVTRNTAAKVPKNKASKSKVPRSAQAKVKPSRKTTLEKRKAAQLKNPADTVYRKINRDSLQAAQADSLFLTGPSKQHFLGAATAARQVKTNIQNSNASAETYSKELITFEIQWHKILASSLACVAMFLIGAPLGAIIKKGGLGMPFLVSIIFFIIYYVISMQGEKLAKQGAITPIMGVWMADTILLVIGMFFLRQARKDARLFEADFYSVIMDKAKTWVAARWRERFEPARP